MDSDQVVEKILAEAGAEAEKIKASADEKCVELQDQLEAELDEYQKQTLALAAQAAQDKKARMMAAAKMEQRKENLAAKVALLDEVFQKASDRIKALQDNQYAEFIENLILQAVETGDEEVIIGTEENRINHDLIQQINHKLGVGFKGNLRLAEKRADIDGGFILKRNSIRVNASTDVLLTQAKEQLEIELAGDLFDED